MPPRGPDRRPHHDRDQLAGRVRLPGPGRRRDRPCSAAGSPTRSPADPTRPFDAVGAVLSAVGMFFVVFGILAGRQQPRADGGAPGGRGRRSSPGSSSTSAPASAPGKEPLLSTGLFKNRTSNLGLVTQNIQWLLLMGVSFTVPVFLQEVRGYNAIETGVIFTAATVGVLVSSLAAERLAKRHAQTNPDHRGLRGHHRRYRAAARAGRGIIARARVRARAAADRPRPRGHADPLGQRRAVQLPRAAAGRDLGPVAQRVEPRLVLRHGDRRHDPGVRPRLGEHVLRRSRWSSLAVLAFVGLAAAIGLPGARTEPA